MDTRDKESFPRTPIALGIVTTIVYVAGFAMVAAWLALLFHEQPRASGAPRPVAACGICGTVEAVRVLRDTGAPQWKRGDRVRVIRGRVEPDFSAAVTPPLASAAPAASPPGRTPSPAPQAARAR